MVGERYRDLIEAADTIHQMRQCTSSVIQSLTSMQTSCNGLRGARQGIIDREKCGKKNFKCAFEYYTVFSVHFHCKGSVNKMFSILTDSN